MIFGGEGEEMGIAMDVRGREICFVDGLRGRGGELWCEVGVEREDLLSG